MKTAISVIKVKALNVASVVVIATSCALNLAAQDIELNDFTFNQWLYNTTQDSFDPDSELALTIESIDLDCNLSDDQKDKLELAGRGDFARFTRRVDELRAQYVGKTHEQNEFGEIFKKVQPLAEVYQAGLLGDDSLFSKVLEKNLSSEQSEKFERMEAQRRQARYKAKVGLFVAALQRNCALTDKQRRELVELLVNETRPPRRFGQYDWYVILCQAGKLRDERYEQIVDEAQMKPLKQTLKQGLDMEQWLKQQKLIDE